MTAQGLEDACGDTQGTSKLCTVGMFRRQGTVISEDRWVTWVLTGCLLGLQEGLEDIEVTAKAIDTGLREMEKGIEKGFKDTMESVNKGKAVEQAGLSSKVCPQVLTAAGVCMCVQ